MALDVQNALGPTSLAAIGMFDTILVAVGGFDRLDQPAGTAVPNTEREVVAHESSQGRARGIVEAALVEVSTADGAGSRTEHAGQGC